MILTLSFIIGPSTGLNEYLDLLKLLSLFLHLNSSHVEQIKTASAEYGKFGEHNYFVMLKITQQYLIGLYIGIFLSSLRMCGSKSSLVLSQYLSYIAERLNDNQVLENICRLLPCNSSSDTSAYYELIKEPYLEALRKNYEEHGLIDTKSWRVKYALLPVAVLFLGLSICTLIFRGQSGPYTVAREVLY